MNLATNTANSREGARADNSIAILCVDDNLLVLEALAMRLGREPGIRCVGTLLNAGTLEDEAARLSPDVVVIDLDMPGRCPLQAVCALAHSRPETRAVFFTGHVSRELVDRAIEAGAWGYICKEDGEGALIDAVKRVREGEIVFANAAQGAMCRL
ncbi:MAG TPA: response regulator transcription factor [Phycisphaerales bacterium]|nr:response regulator transcription factor [Phycisphaerales bacterium]